MIYGLDSLALRVGPRRFSLARDPARTAVVYEDGVERHQRFSAEAGALGAPAPLRYEVPGLAMTLVDVAETPAAASYGPLGAEAALEATGGVASVFPVFKLQDKRVVLSPRINVGFDPALTDAAALAAAAGLTLVDAGRGFAVLECPVAEDVLEHRAGVEALPGVRYAEPDLVTVGAWVRPPAAAPMPFAATAPEVQLAFQRVGAPEAWAQSLALGGLKVAVLDDGVDLAHLALAGAVAGSYDAVTGSPGVTPNDWDYHGTACAGVIGGQTDAPPYRGIAAGVGLLAVRIAHSPAPGQPWATTNSIIRRGIDWAVEAGADVLSNSWGGPPSMLVTEAVQRGLDEGRGGRGAVFVVAAGNSGGPVEFPATLRGVIAVAGVTLDDAPKTFTSADGETWWASNHGPEIDLAAPAVRISTTDNSGAAGRTPTGWRGDFNGTSAACPIVAGAAAELIAAAPHLDAAAVADCLVATAHKPPGVAFVPDGHNDRLGQGRLDIPAALARARGATLIEGPVSAIDLGGGVLVYRVAGATEAAVFLPDPAERPAMAAAAASGEVLVLRFAERVDTPIGAVLKGVRLAAGAGAPPPEPPAPSPEPVPDTAASDTPAPGEVLLPRPEDDIFAGLSAEAPVAASAPPETGEGNGAEDTDQLTRVKGIGAARAARLRAAGIVTLADLAAVTPAQLHELADTLGDLAERMARQDWPGQARGLLAGRAKGGDGA